MIYHACTVFTTRLLTGAAIAAVLLPGQNPPPAQTPEFKDLPALMASLPKTSPKPLDTTSALLFTALPLTCLDDLQPRPGATRPYFWQPTYRTVESYDKTRAFYGCNDWPTAVSATWTLVTLIKKYPDVGSGMLIREKLSAHLGRDNLDGELAYFKGAGNAQRPYGYAWFLRLYAELATWKDPDGTRFAENATPLARFFADGIISYLVDLERPTRAAGQTNSALVLGLLLDYVDATRDMTIKRAVSDAARRLFQTDADCATKSEAATPEMVSPCLAEAAVMSRVLDSAAFTPWFDKFLPAANVAAFHPLLSVPYDVVGGGRGRGRGGPAPPNSANAPAAPGQAGETTPGAARGPQTNPRANWIALAFTRADAYSNLAAALPSTDPRVGVFRRLADIHAESGQHEATSAAAFDAPWVGAYAVAYLTSSRGIQ